MAVEISCLYCNNTFSVIKSRAKTAKFCSRDCVDGYNKTFRCSPITCEACGTTFLIGNYKAIHGRRYCSEACKSSLATINYQCLICGKSFIDNSSSKRKYCSPKCYHESRKEAYADSGNPQWKGGRHEGYYRKFLKESCEGCGATGYLEIHHHDKNRFNNDPNNLVTLCLSCHRSMDPFMTIVFIYLKTVLLYTNYNGSN